LKAIDLFFLLKQFFIPSSRTSNSRTSFVHLFIRQNDC